MTLQYILLLAGAARRGCVMLGMLLSALFASGCRDTGDSAVDPSLPGMVKMDGRRECPVIALYVEPYESTGVMSAVALVWRDGRTLRSADPVWGGSPYFLGNIGKDGVDVLLTELGQGISPALWEFPVGVPFDFPVQVIGLCLDGKWAHQRSAHVLAESSGRVVAAEKWHVILQEGESPDKWIAGFSEEYRTFRREWAFAWEETLKALPDPQPGSPLEDLAMQAVKVRSTAPEFQQEYP